MTVYGMGVNWIVVLLADSSVYGYHNGSISCYLVIELWRKIYLQKMSEEQLDVEQERNDRGEKIRLASVLSKGASFLFCQP